MSLRVDLYNRSRMSREVQVRFCERLGVKFPLPTRLRDVTSNLLSELTENCYIGEFQELTDSYIIDYQHIVKR
jgi:hypothetical protein